MDHTPNTTKMRSDDRVFVLKPIEGMPLNSTGMVDRGLFTGDNKLHARMNKQTMFWTLHYEQGTVPPPLRQSFTSFTKCFKFVQDYYKRRNIDITEVID